MTNIWGENEVLVSGGCVHLTWNAPPPLFLVSERIWMVVISACIGTVVISTRTYPNGGYLRMYPNSGYLCTCPIGGNLHTCPDGGYLRMYSNIGYLHM